MFPFLCVICSLIPSIVGVTFDEDVTLVKSQVDALQEFKERVLPLIPLSYMKEDAYLVKWLQARNFDVDRTERYFKRHLSWRKNTNFDELGENYFQDFETEYPYEFGGVDNEGKPVLLLYLDEWDIRKAIVNGKLKDLNLYTAKAVENGWKKVHEMQQQGKNVTRFTVGLDLKKMNVAQHVNPPSIQFFISAILTYEQSFPKQGDKIWIINTPSVFEVVINLAKSVVNAETRESLQVFGPNKEKWAKELHQYIDPSQLTAPFGGTMPSKYGY